MDHDAIGQQFPSDDFFEKKVWKMFGGMKKFPYLCTVKVRDKPTYL